jgi:hypothetical protein
VASEGFSVPADSTFLPTMIDHSMEKQDEFKLIHFKITEQNTQSKLSGAFVCEVKWTHHMAASQL